MELSLLFHQNPKRKKRNETTQVYNVLTKMGELSAIDGGALLTVRTVTKLSADEAYMKADDIASLAAEYGVKLTCGVVEIAENNVMFDLYPQSA